jgi:molecular chaperone DnaK
MVREAEAHAEEAHRMREQAEARNQAETLLYTTEKTLADHRDSLDSETVSTIETRMQELRGVLESGDAAEIRAKTDALTQASHALAQAVYEKAQSQQAAAANGAGAGSDEDEVVEDAEYEVVDEEAKQS